MNKRTLVIGASENSSRYSFKAIRALLQKKYEVIAIGKQEGEVMGVVIHTHISPSIEVDTVTLYINPSHLDLYEDFLVELKPRRTILNPGTENSALKHKLESKGIKTLEACTLVLLATNQY